MKKSEYGKESSNGRIIINHAYQAISGSKPYIEYDIGGMAAEYSGAFCKRKYNGNAKKSR